MLTNREAIIAQIINDFNIPNISVSQWVQICAGAAADQEVCYMYDGHWHVDTVIQLTRRLWSQYSRLPNCIF